jgi:hypothetical protein
VSPSSPVVSGDASNGDDDVPCGSDVYDAHLQGLGLVRRGTERNSLDWVVRVD